MTKIVIGAALGVSIFTLLPSDSWACNCGRGSTATGTRMTAMASVKAQPASPQMDHSKMNGWAQAGAVASPSGNAKACAADGSCPSTSGQSTVSNGAALETKPHAH